MMIEQRLKGGEILVLATVRIKQKTFRHKDICSSFRLCVCCFIHSLCGMYGNIRTCSIRRRYPFAFLTERIRISFPFYNTLIL